MTARRLAAAVALLIGCRPQPATRSPSDAAPATSPTQDAAPSPEPLTAIAVDGDPNGLVWSSAERRLYIADDDHNRVLVWSDAGTDVLAELPKNGERTALGGLAQLADGTLVVTRKGDTNDVVLVRAGEAPVVVAGLDPARRRLGITVADDGRVYATWFARHGDRRAGGVSRIEIVRDGASARGTEQDVVTGLAKPVGVLAVGDTLRISDQVGKTLLSAATQGGTPPTTLTTIDAPDLLAALPDGTVITGDGTGALRAIGPDGAQRVLASGLGRPRGVAVDPVGRRVFVACHDADETDGVVHRIEIVPLR